MSSDSNRASWRHPRNVKHARVSRRYFLAGLGSATAATAFLAACGDDEEATPTATVAPAETETPTATAMATAEPTAAPTETVGGFPLTLEQPVGAVTIEAPPERIWVVDGWALDFLATLGITPVGASLFTPVPPYVAGPEVDDTEIEFITEGPSLELIAGANPDLIVDISGFFTQFNPSVHEQLKAIAPVLAPPSDALAAGWRERFMHLGKALGLSDEVESSLAGTDERLAAARAQYPELDGTAISFARYNVEPGTFDIIIDESDFTRDFLNNELGFTTPAPQIEAFESGEFEAVGGALSISGERADLVGDGADAALVFVTGELSALTDQPIWQQLPIVTEDRVVFTDFNALLATRVPSPSAIDFMIETVLPPLSEAVQ